MDLRTRIALLLLDLGLVLVLAALANPGRDVRTPARDGDVGSAQAEVGP